jgi:cytosine/adenosine deaminase-related metal-dependent hydrolase
MSPTTLIRSCSVYSVDPEVGYLPNASILIENDVIAAITPEVEGAHGTEPVPVTAPGAVEVIDGRGLLAVPGFIDTHRHTWQTAFRGVAADWTLEEYGAGMHRAAKPLYSAADTYIGNLLGRLEALHSGITTLLDWSHGILTPEHADAAVEGLREAGGRSVFGYSGGFGLPCNDPIETDVRRLRSQTFPSNDGLVTMCLALRGPQYTRLDVTKADVELARELDLRVTVHGGSGPWGRNRPVGKMAELGLLDDRTTVVHCNALADDELQLMADHGATASVSPDVEMQMGFGWPATGRLMAHGIRPSLSIDDCAAMGGDMFATMRSTMVAQRGLDTQIRERGESVAGPLMCRDVVEFATIEGARACGLDHRIGSIKVGKQADLVLIDTLDPTVYPVNNVAGTLVFAAHPGLVHTVLVAGRVVKRDGKLVGVDWPRIRRQIEDSQRAVIERSRKAGVTVALDGSWRPSTDGFAGDEVNPTA